MHYVHMQCPRKEGVLWPLTKLEEINTIFLKFIYKANIFSPLGLQVVKLMITCGEVCSGEWTSLERDKKTPKTKTKKNRHQIQKQFLHDNIFVYSVCTCIPRNMDLRQIFFLTLKFICPCHLLKVKNAFKYFDRIFHSFIFLRASEEGSGVSV